MTGSDYAINSFTHSVVYAVYIWSEFSERGKDMWIRRWGVMLVLIVSMCGALCSCEKRDDKNNAEEQTKEELSRINVVFEGEYNPDNDMIIIIDKADKVDGDGKVTIIGIVTSGADEPYVEFPAGTYIISTNNCSYEIELDGKTDNVITVSFKDGTITGTD